MMSYVTVSISLTLGETDKKRIKGTTVAGCPNYFSLLAPNNRPRHNRSSNMSRKPRLRTSWRAQGLGSDGPSRSRSQTGAQRDWNAALQRNQRQDGLERRRRPYPGTCIRRASKFRTMWRGFPWRFRWIIRRFVLPRYA